MDSNSASDTAAAGLIAGGLIVYFCILAGFVALFIWLYWRIFTKAGYNGALSLLNLIPGVGSLITIIILAFGRWPVEDELAALRAGHPAPPPGTTLSN
ncbi:MAG TPA: hypothetical protein VMH02_12445 [Verrucomicrobiae bacterium]|nr:hypothetical protein [Verrucomicrobiae bacterium]